MRSHSKYKILFLLLILSFSCNSEKEMVSLVSEPVSWEQADSVSLASPSNVMISDSLAFIKSNRSEKFIQVFSYPGFKYLFSIIEKGRGPGELVNLSKMCLDNGNLYALGSETKKLMVFPLDNLKKHITEPSVIKYYEQVSFPILSYAVSNDEVYILNTGDPRVIVINDDGSVKESPFGLPEEGMSDADRINPIYIPSLWNCQMDHDASNHTLAATTMLGDCLEIIDTRSFERKVVVGDGGYPALSTEGGQASLGEIEGYYDVKIFDKHVYTLFSGLSRKKLHEDIRNGRGTPLGGNMIKVYDFEGKLVKTYKLDFYSNGFCIDKDKHSFVLLDPNGKVPVRICDF